MGNILNIREIKLLQNPFTKEIGENFEGKKKGGSDHLLLIRLHSVFPVFFNVITLKLS